MDLVKAAALGALAFGCFSSMVRAADKPLYLQEEEKGRRPLMSAIDRTGGGSMMKDAGIDISGHVEGSYTYSFNQSINDTLTGRVFDDQHDELYLNQAAVVVQRTLEATDDAVLGYKDKLNFGFKIDFMYGQDARLIHSNGLFDHHNDDGARNEEFDLTQAYFTVGIPVGNGLLIKAGKFVTYMGAETINPTTNALYSHSYLFGFAIPFTQTGVSAEYSFNENLSVYGGVDRGWEQSLEDNNDDAVSVFGGLKYTWTPGSGGHPVNIGINIHSGPEQANVQGNWRTVIDFVAESKVADQLTLAINADYGIEDDAAIDGSQGQWYGVAVYAKYDLNKMFAVNARAEWFNDEDGARGLGENVYEATLGLAIKPFPDNELGSNLVIRPEVRFDYGEEDVFDSGTDHQQLTAAVDAIFTF